MKPTWTVISAKRTLDFLAGSAGMAIMAMVHPIVASLIKLESPGPVLYSQERVGLNRRARSSRGGPGGRDRRHADVGGQPFKIWKYRTMRLDAESAGPQLCAKGLDPRVTRAGKWLRALHIDEIPQFLNIIRGEMSLIGPRPERPHFTRQYGESLPHYSDRTRFIRPGLTGLAQILLGYDDSLESVIRKSHYDMSYRASFCSFGSWIKMEAWIVIQTFRYLSQKPQFEGETRQLGSLKRALRLPFQGRAAAQAAPGNTRVAINFGRSARPVVLAGSDPAELSARFDALDFHGRPAADVIVDAKPNLDLEDIGFLLGLAHKVKRNGGRLELRNAPIKVRKILREIRMDGIVDVQQAASGVRNFLTVDVECWFHAHHMRDVAPKSAWHTLPSRIEADMEKLLELLRAHDAKATFFVLGWVAERYPQVVRMIDREGHEIGTHGYHHDLITEMTPSVFEEDLLRSLEAISRNTSQRIRGHRASNFSVVSSTLWALDILARQGLEYDSSIFPIGRKRYGLPDWPNRNPHTLRLPGGRTLAELPMSTMRVAGRQVPVAGGGYLRLYPHQVTENFIAQQNVRGLPAMVYLHPWELDVDQVRRPLGAVKSFQHYVNLDTTEWKLNRLLQRFAFGTVSDTLAMPRLQSLLRRAPVTVPEQIPDPAYRALAAWSSPAVETAVPARTPLRAVAAQTPVPVASESAMAAAAAAGGSASTVPAEKTSAVLSLAEAAAAEAREIPQVDWPLHIGSTGDWAAVRRVDPKPAERGRAAPLQSEAEAQREADILLEDLETTLADAG